MLRVSVVTSRLSSILQFNYFKKLQFRLTYWIPDEPFSLARWLISLKASIHSFTPGSLTLLWL